MSRLADHVYNTLKEEQGKIDTLKDLAKKHNISSPYMFRLLRKQNDTSQITLGTLEKMFPNAVLDLYGNSECVNTTIVGNSNIVNSAISKNTIQDFRQRAIAACLELQVPSDALIAFQKLLLSL